MHLPLADINSKVRATADTGFNQSQVKAETEVMPTNAPNVPSGKFL